MSEDADRRWMRQALELAERSIGMAGPNPPVGCVLVKDERLIGQGWHEYAARDHAEVRALREAGSRAQDATVYLTLEPCSHFGRTPPCAAALISAGVRRAVVARIDPNPVVSGSGIAALRAAGIDVDTGLLHEQAGRLIEPFACHITTGTPLVIGKAGMSLDGRIAPADGRSDSITSPEAREFGHRLRLQADVLLAGIGTILADDPVLTYRGSQPKARPLAVAVLDSALRTPPASRLLDAEPGREIFIFSSGEAPAERRRVLEAKGAEVIPLAHGPEGLDLDQVLRELGSRKKLGVLVEGGSEVHWSFFRGQAGRQVLLHCGASDPGWAGCHPRGRRRRLPVGGRRAALSHPKYVCGRPRPDLRGLSGVFQVHPFSVDFLRTPPAPLHSAA